MKRRTAKPGHSSPDSALPERLRERLGRIVPIERFADVLASFDHAPDVTFRVNSLAASDADVLAELAADGTEAVPAAGLPHVYRASAELRARLARSAAFASGRMYIQTISSLLAAPAMDVRPGLRVLDLAAAPGGKTLHLAALLGNDGDLRAVESSRPRFHRLRENLRRAGVSCCRTFLQDGRRVGELCPEQFDRVLLDAPCSGEARLRRTPAGEADAGEEDSSRRPNWSLRKIQQCAGKQRALLRSAVAACRPGGLIVYCTCTFAPEENEAVVADVLEEAAGGLAVEPAPLPECAQAESVEGLRTWESRSFPAELAEARRILPDEWFDAFFLCRLRKLG